MLTWLVLQLPLTLLPAPATPPECQLEVLPAFVLEERVVEDFNHRVAHYVRLHRRLERALPPEHLFDDLEDMTGAIDALHAAIVDARPNARPGSIFTPAVAALLTRRLEQAIDANRYSPAEVLAAMNVGSLPGMPEPEINGRLPDTRNIQVWPALLAVLPRLPDELQYRFFDRDLALVDFHADLIVDILEDALPPAR